MQDVQMPSHRDLTTNNLQHSDEMPPYPPVTYQHVMADTLASRRIGGEYVDFDAVSVNHHEMPSEFGGNALKTALNGSGLSDNRSVGPSSNHTEGQPMDEFNRPFSTEARMLSKCDNSLQTRVNSTSNSTMIASHDLASTLASEIAKRLGLGSSAADKSQCNSRKNFEKAIQDTVDDLLGSNQTPKKYPQELASRGADESRKLFKCEVCSKKKKTQSDLTYIPVSLFLSFFFGICIYGLLS